MNKVDKDNKNVKKCPRCGDTMGINDKCQPICSCEIPAHTPTRQRRTIG
jgi:hypothetical protein